MGSNDGSSRGTDPLTGVADRAWFLGRLDDAAASGRKAGVVLVDLDGFAVVNDVLGYVAGDRILTAVGQLLRDTAGEGDTVGRLGGDQFGVLAEGAALDELAERITAALASPVQADGRPVAARASIGVAHAARGDGGTDLLSKADVALRTAKASGRGRPVHYESAMKTRFLDQAALLDGLHEAVGGGQMELVYQPIVRLGDGTLTGLEALARWRHPVRGPIMPGDFIPVAERSGLIVPLGRWMLAEVCREQADDWPDTYVNTSAHQLREPGFAETVTNRLVIEVTEDALQDESATAALRVVRDRGVRVALDDFGAGRASLPALASAPIDVVKVHGSMTGQVLTSPRHAAVAGAVAELAAELGIVAIAKAVESAAQAERLHELGYQQGMGFHYAVPQPAAAIPLFLANEVVHVI
ncbi:EAL domain-containing protein [Actinoplanes sp. TBRC 11911]|uniref:putative bifunctional diguanylate cyclase/phosphodiesterase n=1 Tax=Actinoplanes sp. TBRC 11911 TaxID=2729386 RepID=UPI00145F5640|nr:EAL domain-containing protein [Actinoplanes sp. TBRC 11911]NMO51899.1 EAL domain-containing protein [Actinoplanes sp. TBRC 11911]